VTPKTKVSLIFLISSPGTDTTHTAEMIKRLKAADPTIVAGPSSPGVPPRSDTVSIHDKSISGAEDPSAIKVRLAIVGFHTEMLASLETPLSSSYFTLLVWEVITSIEPMKISAMIAIPKNR